MFRKIQILLIGGTLACTLNSWMVLLATPEKSRPRFDTSGNRAQVHQGDPLKEAPQLKGKTTDSPSEPKIS